jgi:hypothetical protein
MFKGTNGLVKEEFTADRRKLHKKRCICYSSPNITDVIKLRTECGTYSDMRNEHGFSMKT